MPSPVDTAFALVQDGRFVEAEVVMAREVARHLAGTAAWASAQCDLGNVLLSSDQPARAAECFRQAADTAPGEDYQARKDCLTYRMNLGMALQEAGQFDQAEAQLRGGAQERMAFYGRDHAGYAFGLEPLARLLLARDKTAEARPLADEIVRNYWTNGHPRLAPALVLRAEVVRAQATAEPLFPVLDPLPNDVLVAMAGTSSSDPVVLTALADAVEARLGPDHQQTLNVLSALANAGRDSGDNTGRVDAIRRVLASYDRQGRPQEALMASMGLALAQSETGDVDGLLATYADADQRAARLGRADLRSQVLRNWGLALRDAGRTDEAQHRLAAAVAEARRSEDAEMLGRAGVAYGIFLQHLDRLDEAQTVLREAIAALDPTHPDGLIGRTHLAAAEQGGTCGCENLAGTVEEAFRQFVMMRLPADLVEDFQVRVVDGQTKMDVRLRREPLPAELERLNAVVSAAHAEFRNGLKTK
jgi:tetratricopeptide (TPR) repeat protein